MKDRFVHYHEDPTGILGWLAEKNAVEASPQDRPAKILLEADNSPAPSPVEVPEAIVRKTPISRPRAETCGHCGNPLPSIRSARKAFCNRHCAKAARG
jgi:hypothetical protein